MCGVTRGTQKATPTRPFYCRCGTRVCSNATIAIADFLPRSAVGSAPGGWRRNFHLRSSWDIRFWLRKAFKTTVSVTRALTWSNPGLPIRARSATPIIARAVYGRSSVHDHDVALRSSKTRPAHNTLRERDTHCYAPSPSIGSSRIALHVISLGGQRETAWTKLITFAFIERVQARGLRRTERARSAPIEADDRPPCRPSSLMVDELLS